MNGKWIPINEKLPPLGECIFTTVKDHIRRRMELRYPVYYLKHPDREGYGFYLGDINSVLLPDVSEIIAWMPIPKPYEPSNIDDLKW